MQSQTSGELAGWLAYLHIDDEVKIQQTAIAIHRAFTGGKAQSARGVVDDDDEEVIDTTKPEFAEKFKGFTNTPLQPQRGMPQRQMSTEILLG